MDFFTFQVAGYASRKPRRAAVVSGDDWEGAIAQLARFDLANNMQAEVEASEGTFSREWQAAIGAAQPWLGSASIDCIIATGNTWALRPRDAAHLQDGDAVTLIIEASEGDRRRVLSWALTTRQPARADNALGLEVAPVMDYYLGDTGLKASGRDLAEAILTAFP